jgi:subtilase family serine protease
VALSVALVGPASATTGGGGAASGTGAGQTPFSGTARSACAAAPTGYASCLAEVIVPSGETSRLPQFTHPGAAAAATVPATISGLSPTNIDAVYGFSQSSSECSTPGTAGCGETIAIVDAFDDPTAASDLSTFSSQWGLPPCTTGNGCFTKVNGTGGTNLPNSNQGWALEISLDIEWAHAMAPGAKILLVEATNNSMKSLVTAESYAGSQANYVSNSWGGSEFLGETNDDNDFSGTASYFAATGDSAGEVDYPATSPNVVAVGGTSLSFNPNGSLATESAWSDGGGGCSSYETAPAVQSTFSQYAQVGCDSDRSVPDVSLDADPNSGVAIYDSNYSPPGWLTVGGTSVATPIWAAESAVNGLSASPQTIYTSSNTPSFRDITSGSNGNPTLVGYDLATGRGSWAFGAPPAPTGLAETASSGAVALSWSPASGATSYDVYRGTKSGGESTTPIASDVTGTTYNDATVTNGRTYYYEVEGANSVGTGSPSNQVQAQPSAGGSSTSNPPARPTGLVANSKRTGVVLKWTATPGATSYIVLRSTSPGAETSLATGVPGATYTDTNIDPSTIYYYEVEAVNSHGDSTASAPVVTTSRIHLVVT